MSRARSGTSRERYFSFLSDGGSPRVRELAAATVSAALRELQPLQRSIGALEVCEPFDYTATALQLRVDQIYRLQAGANPTLEVASEAELRRMHLRFAPMALVDGCWLSRIGRIRRESPALLTLHGIYADEAGNGRIEHNHANLYRALMRSFGESFDDPALEELRTHPEIPAHAFKLPAFLLALGIASNAHLPELLGTTLAVELSGLDGFYASMIRALESTGKDAAFWRVHVSIDNYSTGHARQALQAIVLHMEEVMARHGEDAGRLVWQRLWNGFVLTMCLLRIELALVVGATAKADAS